MTAIQQDRWDQLLRRVADLKGPGSKVNDALTELFPVFDVENMPMELLRLGRVRTCMGGGAFSAVVAESPTAQLFNPVDSGILITVSSVWISFQIAVVIRWGVTNAEIGTPISTELFRDTRDLVPTRPGAAVNTRSAVATASGTMQTLKSAQDDFILQDPNGVAVLAPGTGFEIGAAQTNVAGNFGFYWRERVAEPSELNL